MLGPQRDESLGVIEARAEALDVPLLVHGRDWSAERVEGRLLVAFGDDSFDLPPPALEGAHQIENAGLAVIAALQLGALAPSMDSIAKGLEQARWPARLQALTEGPLPALLPEGSSLWLDGGHNPAAGEALAACFDDDDPRPLHLVVGMMNTKDSNGFLAPMIPLSASVRAVPVPGEEASRDPAEVVQDAIALGAHAGASPDVSSALAAIATRTGMPVRVLICGSLYLAGQVLRANS